MFTPGFIDRPKRKVMSNQPVHPFGWAALGRNAAGSRGAANDSLWPAAPGRGPAGGPVGLAVGHRPVGDVGAANNDGGNTARSGHC